MGISEIKKDFDLLTKEANIAFYKTAKITSVFITVSDDLINVFSRVTLDENENVHDTKYLTKNLEKINDDISLGIIKKKVSLKDAKSAFELLIDSNKWVIDGKNIVIDDLQAVNKVLVPSLMDVKVNTALETMENDSYTIEFFSEDVNVLNKYLKDTEYLRMCEIIKDEIDIDFEFLRDRIGNIIFQFPITLLKAKAQFNSDQVEIETNWHSSLIDIPEVEVFVYITCDNNVVGSATYSGIIDKKETLECGNSDGSPVISIKNKENDLFLFFANKFKMNISANMKHNLKEVRTLLGKDPIKLCTCEPFLRIGTSSEPYIKRINERKYDELTDLLIKEKKFVEYGVNGIDEHEKALSDIKLIIENNCEYGAYLWDPYAYAQDILDTLYYCPCYNNELRVITSIDWDEYQINLINLGSNHKGINLEVRCQNSSGWPFHDRFLIFPGSDYDKPRVWSLGSSINSIGKSHSILIEVKNAQNILNSFNELWKKLDDNVIWKHH